MPSLALDISLRGLLLFGTKFSPSLLFASSEPGVWYDPSDLNTLFQDNAGTTPVTAAGQPVGRMLDKSGHGNHATQSTAGQRPTYAIMPKTGIRNLMTYTERFDNAAWTKLRTSVIVDTTVAPDGTSTADRLVEDTTASNSHLIIQNLTIAASSAYSFSVYVKADGRNFCRILVGDTGGNNSVRADVNLTDGSFTTGSAGTGWTLGSATAVSVGNSWYRVTISGTNATATSGVVIVYMASALGTIAYTGDGTSGIYIWGAQLETGSTATAYQKVVTKYEVTEAGVQSLSYLSFDGIDDVMVTPTITPNTDKVQVFSGVRKLSDAATGIIAELSANVTTNAGALDLRAPSGATSNYQFTTRGSSIAAVAASPYAAPITNIVTGIGDISGDVAALRVNGTQVALSTTDQGTGNYLAYPLYIGRRGGTSLPFNGNLYGLIVRFGANLDDSSISNAETWMNQKTGAY